MAADFPYLTYRAGAEPGRATIRIDAGRAAPFAVPRRLFGKFCEHLGANIYHGMEAQILLNATFSRWRFSAGDNHPDGGVQTDADRDNIHRRIVQQGGGRGWPTPDAVAEAYYNGGAFGWFASGQVRLSPDVGPHGDRAQRIEAGEDQAGLAQWLHLPLHRTHSFGFRMVARAVAPVTARIVLAAEDGGPGASAEVTLNAEWQTLHGELDLPQDGAPDALHRLTLQMPAGANVVVDRLMLYPDDHVNGADPEIIALLREAKLPLLRWPGGNFVSGYDWRDGIGPIDARPVKPNPAWAGLEFNTFGTAEFIAFCRAVGCEPMICVNAGNGSADEAAAWVEYCNGGPETAMGRLRAEHGHPEPFGVRLWEIGNEIYGRWQVGWTTPAGNADRYHRFREAMLAADPAIELIGCGQGNAPLGEWNRTLIESAGADLKCITDHVLTGGNVTGETDPLELVQAFLGYAPVLESRFAELREVMAAAGIREPRLAITELQLFAHFQGEPGKLTRDTMPRQDSVAEALYLMTIVHAAARLGEFVELITHSATVNHGGGLRKQRERVWPNPVHHAHAMGIALADGTPLAVELECARYSTHHAFATIPALQDVPVLDVLAARHDDGSVVVSVVNRGQDTVTAELRMTGISTAAEAQVQILSGEAWHDRNTLEEPARITPRASTVRVESGRARLELPAMSLAVLALPLA